jgi:opacity protein-like surface antigen
MKRSLVVLFSTLCVAGAVSARAQVVPSATRGHVSITVGGMASIFQPDYAGNDFREAAPNRLYGVGAYVDVKFNRWVQLEAEGRWLRFNEFEDIYQDNYLIGERLPLHRFKFMGATPYVKALGGFSKMNFENNVAWGRYADFAFGGGVDFKVTKRISVRGDFESQIWPSWPGIPGVANSSLYPYGGSVGVGYRIF